MKMIGNMSSSWNMIGDLMSYIEISSAEAKDPNIIPEESVEVAVLKNRDLNCIFINMQEFLYGLWCVQMNTILIIRYFTG